MRNILVLLLLFCASCTFAKDSLPDKRRDGRDQMNEYLVSLHRYIDKIAAFVHDYLDSKDRYYNSLNAKAPKNKLFIPRRRTIAAQSVPSMPNKARATIKSVPSKPNQARATIKSVPSKPNKARPTPKRLKMSLINNNLNNANQEPILIVVPSYSSPMFSNFNDNRDNGRKVFRPTVFKSLNSNNNRNNLGGSNFLRRLYLVVPNKPSGPSYPSSILKSRRNNFRRVVKKVRRNRKQLRSSALRRSLKLKKQQEQNRGFNSYLRYVRRVYLNNLTLKTNPNNKRRTIKLKSTPIKAKPPKTVIKRRNVLLKASKRRSPTKAYLRSYNFRKRFDNSMLFTKGFNVYGRNGGSPQSRGKLILDSETFDGSYDNRVLFLL